MKKKLKQMIIKEKTKDPLEIDDDGGEWEEVGTKKNKSKVDYNEQQKRIKELHDDYLSQF